MALEVHGTLGASLTEPALPPFVRPSLALVAFWGSSGRLMAARICYARGRTWNTTRRQAPPRAQRSA
jgi:hypothetical protein